MARVSRPSLSVSVQAAAALQLQVQVLFVRVCAYAAPGARVSTRGRSEGSVLAVLNQKRGAHARQAAPAMRRTVP
jgi:hypothetical protein